MADNVFESPQSRPPAFKDELQHILNKHGMDNRVGIPDFMLAEFITQMLVNWERMKKQYDRWRAPDGE